MPAPGVAVDCSYINGNGTSAVMFRQSKFCPLKVDDPYGSSQGIYLNENVTELYNFSPAGGGTIAPTFPGGNVLQASPSLTGINLLPLWDVGAAGYINYARNAKTSFDGFDQYMLGKQSCGSYLFVSADDHENIQVDGDSIQSYELIDFGQQNSINIPLVFQYRMTDYYGVTTGSGLGNIAGDETGSTVNLTYSKKIGFDIYPNNKDVVQFDVEVFAKYRSDRLSIDVFPKATVTRGLNDLEKVVASLRPSLGQTAVNAGSNLSQSTDSQSNYQ